MKRILTILLAVLFIYSSCIYYIIQLVELGHCRTAAISAHPTSRIRYLLLTPGTYEVYGDDEIRFEGKMYDVIGRQAHHDKIVFCLVVDEREGALLASIQNHLVNFFDSAGKTAHAPLKILSFLFDKISFISQVFPEPVYETVSARHHTRILPFINLFDPSSPYPPPRQS